MMKSAIVLAAAVAFAAARRDQNWCKSWFSRRRWGRRYFSGSYAFYRCWAGSAHSRAHLHAWCWHSCKYAWYSAKYYSQIVAGDKPRSRWYAQRGISENWSTQPEHNWSLKNSIKRLANEQPHDSGNNWHNLVSSTHHNSYAFRSGYGRHLASRITHWDGHRRGYGNVCDMDEHCSQGQCFGGKCESLDTILPVFAMLAYRGSDHASTHNDPRAKNVYGFREDCRTDHSNSEGGIWVNHKRRMVIMAVRGTSEGNSKDTATNRRMIYGPDWNSEKYVGVWKFKKKVYGRDSRWTGEQSRYSKAKHIANHHGYQLILTGHSMGGAMVLKLAKHHPGEFIGHAYNPYCKSDNRSQRNLDISQWPNDWVIKPAGGWCDCGARNGHGHKNCDDNRYIKRMGYYKWHGKTHSIKNYVRTDQKAYLRQLLNTYSKCY